MRYAAPVELYIRYTRMLTVVQCWSLFEVLIDEG